MESEMNRERSSRVEEALALDVARWEGEGGALEPASSARRERPVGDAVRSERASPR
jgi:hypothetical protein